jgi:hypothetical protein
MLVHYDTETVAIHYLPAIFNDDYTGLNDEEHEELDKWLDKQPKNATFACDDDMMNSFFGKDVVTGLMADCVELQVYTNE